MCCTLAMSVVGVPPPVLIKICQAVQIGKRASEELGQGRDHSSVYLQPFACFHDAE